MMKRHTGIFINKLNIIMAVSIRQRASVKRGRMISSSFLSVSNIQKRHLFLGCDEGPTQTHKQMDRLWSPTVADYDVCTYVGWTFWFWWMVQHNKAQSTSRLPRSRNQPSTTVREPTVNTKWNNLGF